MNYKFAIACALLFVFSVKARDSVAMDLFLSVQQKLEKAHSLSYEVETKYHIQGEDRIIRTHFKQKKLSYDPYLGYSFYKNIDENIKIYYHFLELGVIEENKNMLSIFNHTEDDAFPKYVSSYSHDLDNLWRVTVLMEDNKETFSFEAMEIIEGKKYYKYRMQNYFLWIDSKMELPYKLESLTRNGNAKTRIYRNIAFNKEMDESIYIYPKNKGHVLVHRDPNPNPLVGNQAISWELKDIKNRKIRSDSYKGKPMFIEVWSSECNHCISSFPAIKEIHEIYGESIHVITINMDYDLMKTKQAIQKYQLPFTVLQGDAAFYRDYLIRSFPSYFVIDKEGEILLHERGAIKNVAKTRLYQILDKVIEN